MRQAVKPVVFASCVLVASSASAQIAEELAAYVLTGVENGAQLEYGGVQAVWKRVQAAPPKFVAEGARDNRLIRFTLTASKIGECQFEIAGVAAGVDPPNLATDIQDINDVISIHADFSRIEKIVVVDGEIAVVGEGLCVRDKVNPDCHQDVTGITSKVDAKRHQQALERLGVGSCRR